MEAFIRSLYFLQQHAMHADLPMLLWVDQMLTILEMILLLRFHKLR